MNDKGDLKRRVYLYSLQMIKLIDILNKYDISVKAIAAQLIRSATSIGANVAEAQGAIHQKILQIFLIMPSSQRMKVNTGWVYFVIQAKRTRV